MKRQLITLAALVSAGLPGHVVGQNDSVRPAPTTEQRSDVRRSERFGYPNKASEIIGKEVTNLQNEKLGKVDELAIDVDAGRVALVIINSGGVLGVGAKSVAVPPRALSYDASTKSLRLDANTEKFKGSPAFEMSHWEDAAPTNYLWETHRYYGQRPYFAGPGSSNDVRQGRNTLNDETRKTEPDEKRNTDRRDRDNVQREERETVGNVVAPATRWGRLEKASKVIGLPVVNKENKKCGTVDNLIVDLPMGRIVHFVISSGGFLGIGDALNAVPPSALRFTSSRDSLLLDISKEELSRAPYFKSSEWPNFSDPTYSEKVYKSYGADPYFSTDADNTARNVRDRQENRLTPVDQGTSDADVQMTRRIRQDILAREGLSVSARNIKVITVNGRVTLRGPVNDETEKRIIAEIANRAAQSGNVDNQLEITKAPYKE